MSRAVSFRVQLFHSLDDASSRQCRYHKVDTYTSMVISPVRYIISTMRVSGELMDSTKSVLEEIVRFTGEG